MKSQKNYVVIANEEVACVLREAIPLLHVALLISLFFFTSYTTQAGNYTWTGTTSTDWNTANNWSDSIVPISSDSVTIETGSNNCVLAANAAVGKLTVNSGTLNLNSYTLLVTTEGIFIDGTVNSGTLTLYVTGTGKINFGGTTFGAAVNATGNIVAFSGGTFNSTVLAVKKGSGSSTGSGGCTFSSVVTLIDSGSGSWTFADGSADTWSDKVTVTEASSGIIFFAHNSTSNSFSKTVTFTNTSNGKINCNYYGSSDFHDSIVVNSTSSGSIYFGQGGGVTTLDTSTIMIASSGFSSSGTLYLSGILQLDSTKSVSLTTTGTTKILFERGSLYEGRVTVSAPYLVLNSTRFFGVSSFTHTAANKNSSTGGCYFGDSTLIIHDATGGSFFTGTAGEDTFAAPVTIRNANLGMMGVINALFQNEATFVNQSTGTGGAGTISTVTFLVGDAGVCTFNDSITVSSTSTAVAFGTSGGNVIFNNDADINILSTYSGGLMLTNVTQFGSNEVNIPFQNNSGVLLLDNSNFEGPVICNVKRAIVNSNTFGNSFYLKRTGSISDTWEGNNEFVGHVTLIDSSLAHDFSLANVYPDIYNNDVTIKN